MGPASTSLPGACKAARQCPLTAAVVLVVYSSPRGGHFLRLSWPPLTLPSRAYPPLLIQPAAPPAGAAGRGGAAPVDVGSLLRVPVDLLCVLWFVSEWGVLVQELSKEGGTFEELLVHVLICLYSHSYYLLILIH